MPSVSEQKTIRPAAGGGPPNKSNEPAIQRLTLDQKPLPFHTSTIIKMQQAGTIDARAQYFQQLTDASGKNGKDLKPEENEDIRRILGPNVSSAFKPVYAFEELVRFHEAWREDGIVAMCLELMAQSIFGDHFKTVIDTNKQYNNEEERKAALDMLTSNPTLLRYKAALDKINKDTRATQAFKALFVQGAVFGADAAIIERDKEDSLPIAIKILPAMSLGRRFVHKSTWDLLGIEYLDYQFPDSIVPASDIFYIAFRDYHMSPGTFHYGYSLVEKIVYLSETNRVINQRNLPETNFRLWSPMLLCSMPGSLNKGTMDSTREALKNGAGNVVVVNQQTRVEPVTINVSVQEMTTERAQNNLEIIRQLQFPELLYNPDIMNRATSQELMEAWNIFVLQPYQTWISDLIQEQWIDPILKTLIDNDQAGIIDEPSEVEGYVPPEEQQSRKTTTPTPSSSLKPIKPKPNPPSASAGNLGLVPPGGSAATLPPPPKQQQQNLTLVTDPHTGEVEISDQDWKIKVVFEPANMDTFLDKVKAYMILFAGGQGPVSGERVLKGIGLDDEIPVYQEREAQKAEWQQQQFNLQQKVIDVKQVKQVEDKAQQQQGTGIKQMGPRTGFNPDVSGALSDQIKQATKVSASSASTLLPQPPDPLEEYTSAANGQKFEQEQRTKLFEIVTQRILNKIDEI